jgi:hypothetical protein
MERPDGPLLTHVAKDPERVVTNTAYRLIFHIEAHYLCEEHILV